MSATNELIQTVYEFRSLLKYLGERYPKILNEWKLGTGPGTTEPNTKQRATNFGIIKNGYKQDSS